jgi:hypothetical protein
MGEAERVCQLAATLPLSFHRHFVANMVDDAAAAELLRPIRRSSCSSRVDTETPAAKRRIEINTSSSFMYISCVFLICLSLVYLDVSMDDQGQHQPGGQV